MNIGVAEATFMTRYFNVIVAWNWNRLGIFVGDGGNHFEWGLLTYGVHLEMGNTKAQHFCYNVRPKCILGNI